MIMCTLFQSLYDELNDRVRLYNRSSTKKQKVERLTSDVSDLSHSVKVHHKKAFELADKMVASYCRETAKSFARSNCIFISS